MELERGEAQEVWNEMVWNSLTWLVQVVVFPGFLTLIALALFYEWVDRKFVAKLQNRYGPLHVGPHGLLQPIADLIKLLSKEDITPFAADRVIFAASPLILLASPLTALLFIPMSGVYSTVGFEGDLLLVLFLFMLPMIAIFLGSWASANRFTAVGAVRATLQLLAYEVPMGMAAIGTAIAARSLSISRIVAWQAGSGVWLAVIQPLGFIVFTMCVVAELRRVPFDAPTAETEIVAGWETEFSGRKLAVIRLGEDLSTLLLAGLAVSLYLGGPAGPAPIPPIVYFLAKVTAYVLLISLIRAAFARFRIDQTLRNFWGYLLPLSIVQVLVVQLLAGGVLAWLW